MHSRGEVRSFLQSAAEYWLNEYHIDGLRMDAISRAIYWQGMPERGVNSNAVEFLRYMNQGLKERHPSVILAAEDSTSFPGVTKPAEEGGLGFDYKWDMGWMNDTLDYFRTAPEYRTRDYHKLTFSMMYYYDERYLLPLSHDEVVHGKATILQKMYGDYGQKFPQARAFYMYMYAHPGKKLNFMGNEIGHFREWDEKRELDWNLLTFPAHQDFHRFMEDLNHFYLEHPALSELDYDTEGFQWLECHAEEKCVYVFERCTKERRNETGKSRDQMNRQERIVAAFNFSDEEQEIEIKCEDKKSLKRVFSSEYKEYGGQEEKKEKIIKAKKEIATLKLKPFSAEYYLIQSCD